MSSATQTTATDRVILRDLGSQIAEVAALPTHKQTAAEWRRLNGLGGGRPLVWVNEICWNEFAAEEELALQCQDPWARAIETELRQTLYQWRHLPGDMVVEGVIYSPLIYHDSGLGIAEDVVVARTDETSSVVSRDYHSQIDSEDDIEKIRFPEITPDPAATEREYERRCEVFEGVLPVVKRGVGMIWFAPWDELIRWWDVQKAMLDLVLRPELVHAAMDRLVSAHLYRLDQLEGYNLLAQDNGNERIGSGGLGFCDELPQPSFDGEHVRTVDQWGCATAQIFSEVSPAMHEEFALQYERRWLERFGLTYYGCCEPLHNKLGILSTVRNLRKISVSPWADAAKMAELVGDTYVLSHKPNPAILAEDTWRPEEARRWVRESLEKMAGCSVELILKDISTVRYEPRRLWEWTRICAEEAERAAS